MCTDYPVRQNGMLLSFLRLEIDPSLTPPNGPSLEIQRLTYCINIQYICINKQYTASMILQLFPTARAKILQALFQNPSRSLHLRELARISGMSVGSVQAEVNKLSKIELLLQRRDGNRLYFSANTENPIYEDIRNIVIKTTGVRPRLLEALNHVDGIHFAFVYGSFAQNNQSANSDIDLMVIGKIGLRALVPPLKPIAESMNRELNPTVYSESAFSEKWRAKDAFILEVTKSEKLWIIGNEDDLRSLA